ncbi:MAG: cytochrome c oxidase subunit 3 [Bacteroidetes bacterium]|nr:cytochrome c oxidase subunit 3 [Bacteroidota bacterium]
MELTLPENEKQITKIKATRGLLWLGLISISMLFAGLTSGYIVRQGEGKWAQFALPSLFIVSTILIVLSSIAMQWAVVSVRKENQSNFKLAVSLTTVFGIGFVVFQYLAWSQLVSQGIYFVGQIKDITGAYEYIPAAKETAADIANTGNVAGSFLYVITGLHVAHVLGGMIALLVVLLRALSGKYSKSDHNGVRLCAIYWHFLGGLWVYLFFFLLYIR